MRQRVIVYSLDGITEQIYCTVYDDVQASDALIDCVQRHGIGSRPTIEDAFTVYAYSY
jgi:hypothetical protein